ncbi:hypothetical protein TNCV_294271 [Trichonephila clavipes]|nr:hypothetical protein TNCV_294271 [Trichonephila clavipes]
MHTTRKMSDVGMLKYYSYLPDIVSVGSLAVRAPDSEPEGLRSMPVTPNTLRVHTEYVLAKSVGPKILWAESRVQRTGEISLHFSAMPKL